MASYPIDFGEVGKQHSQLTEQLGALSKVLDELVNIEETMLGAAQWTAGDKKEFTERFQAFIEGGRKLHESGVKEAEALQKIADAYKNAENA